MNLPRKPPPPAQPERPRRRQGPEPVNPDPKTHPIHPAIGPEPIREGTDPPKPVKTRRLP